MCALGFAAAAAFPVEEAAAEAEAVVLWISANTEAEAVAVWIGANKGNADDQYELGCLYNEDQVGPPKIQGAAEWWRKAADQGHPCAQNELGWAYQTGQGVLQDSQAAVMWQHKAADQNHELALFALGCHYSWGWGVTENPTRGVKYWLQAADLGNSEAQFNIGNYYKAKGDDEQALVWYRKGADEGHEICAKRVLILVHKQAEAEQANKGTSAPLIASLAQHVCAGSCC